MIKNRTKRVVFFSLVAILANFFIEAYILYFENRAPIILFQSLFNIVSVLFISIYIKRFRLSRIGVLIILISCYTLFMTLLSSDLIHSFNMTLKFVLPLFYLIIGYNIITSYDHFLFLINKLWLILLFFVLNTVYVNIYDVGESFYKEGISVGYMTLNSIYTVFFVLIIFIFFQSKIKINNIVSSLLIIFTTIIFILLLKRTFIVLLIAAYFLLLIRKLSFKKIFYASILAAGTIVLINIYFSDVLVTAVEGRSSRFSESYEVTSEGRLTENLLPLKYMGNNPLMYLFGTGEVFNDRPYFIKYIRLDRELHNSFARLFWSGGFMMIFLFLLLYYRQFSMILKSYRLSKSPDNYKFLFYFGLALIFLRFINEFSSGITYVSYNSLLYLLIGGVLAISVKYGKAKSISQRIH